MMNDGYRDRETMYVSELLGDDYGDMLLEQEYSFGHREDLVRHIAVDVESRVRSVVEHGSDVLSMVMTMLAYVDWDELAFELMRQYPELIGEGS